MTMTRSCLRPMALGLGLAAGVLAMGAKASETRGYVISWFGV